MKAPCKVIILSTLGIFSFCLCSFNVFLAVISSLFVFFPIFETRIPLISFLCVVGLVLCCPLSIIFTCVSTAGCWLVVMDARNQRKQDMWFKKQQERLAKKMKRKEERARRRKQREEKLKDGNDDDNLELDQIEIPDSASVATKLRKNDSDFQIILPTEAKKPSTLHQEPEPSKPNVSPLTYEQTTPSTNVQDLTEQQLRVEEDSAPKMFPRTTFDDDEIMGNDICLDEDVPSNENPMAYDNSNAFDS